MRLEKWRQVWLYVEIIIKTTFNSVKQEFTLEKFFNVVLYEVYNEIFYWRIYVY